MKLTSFNGSWVPNSSAGGSRKNKSFSQNPQYRVTLSDSDQHEDNLCTLVVSLIQKNRRSLRDKGLNFLPIGFAIYSLSEEHAGNLGPLDSSFFEDHKPTVETKSFPNTRERVVEDKLPPGSYVIVPSTLNPGEEGDFYLRVLTEPQANSVKQHDVKPSVSGGRTDVTQQPPAQDPALEARLRQMFNQVSGVDRKMDSKELLRLLEAFDKSCKPSEATSKAVIALFDTDHTGELDCVQLKEALNFIKSCQAASSIRGFSCGK